MSNKQTFILTVGQPYPMPLNKQMNKLGIDAGSANLFFDNTNVIQIGVNKPTKKDIRAFREKPIYAGFIYRHPCLVLYFRFASGITFECPYDHSILPSELLNVPDKMDQESRLVLQFHFFDTSTTDRKVVWLREATLNKHLTTEILDAVMMQRVNFQRDAFELAMTQIVNLDLEQAYEMSNPRIMGV
ncbi:hypothetical protein ABT56_19220 [Photobacterium aquae]|uniref:Uncharacterized protein n=1 Tax=Photobacterium aquae TaxID=1195763 RepID=A0A0J1GV00_9GAMM|nr:hypothetical protein [Photobacterium aquae]KLV03560.1 hypothetical protein ABT56_19220 [Photobacterium aquae]